MHGERERERGGEMERNRVSKFIENQGGGGSLFRAFMHLSLSLLSFSIFSFLLSLPGRNFN